MGKKIWLSLGIFVCVLNFGYGSEKSLDQSALKSLESIIRQVQEGKLTIGQLQAFTEHRNPFDKNLNNVFHLLKITDSRTTEELVRAGNYNYANSDINSKNFPARARKEKSVKIEFIKGDDFDHDPTSEEVLQEAEKRGLKRPVYEDALYFGVEHLEVQRQEPVVFLHEPWRGFGGDLRVVSLWSYDGNRWLNLLYFASRWDRYYRFAFVRK